MGRAHGGPATLSKSIAARRRGGESEREPRFSGRPSEPTDDRFAAVLGNVRGTAGCARPAPGFWDERASVEWTPVQLADVAALVEVWGRIAPVAGRLNAYAQRPHLDSEAEAECARDWELAVELSSERERDEAVLRLLIERRVLPKGIAGLDVYALAGHRALSDDFYTCPTHGTDACSCAVNGARELLARAGLSMAS